MNTKVTVVDKTAYDELRLRDATLSDLDGIAVLAQEALADDPERDYRFPYRAQHPQDNWKWTRRAYELYMEQPKLYHTIVVEAISHGEAAAKIVALAVWDIRHLTGHHQASPPQLLGEHERQDANIVHMQRFSEALGEISDTYFLQYGNRQIHLVSLGTHASYRRRDCGGALCRWGIEKATENGWVVTVSASPMGRLLYMAGGFSEVGAKTIYVEGEDEKLCISALVYHGRQHAGD